MKTIPPKIKSGPKPRYINDDEAIGYLVTGVAVSCVVGMVLILVLEIIR